MTDDSHGMVTAEPVLSTTIVFGLAAATAVIRLSWAVPRSMLVRSEPSDSPRLAKTTATLAAAAADAAELSEEPLLYVTVVPDGAAAWMPASGVTVPLELTPALPPPSVCGLVEASAPMTAIDVSEEDSGRMLPEFFSSTVPSSASCVASFWLVEFVAVADGDPLGAAQRHVLADRGDQVRELLADGPAGAGIARRFQPLDVIAIGKHQCGHRLDEALEDLVARHEISLAVDLDDGARAAVRDRAHQALGGDPAGLLRGGGQALLAQPVHGLLEIARDLAQRPLAIHHAGAGLLAQFLDERSGDLSHDSLSPIRMRRYAGHEGWRGGS